MKLAFRNRLGLFLRVLSLQSSWSFRFMQGLGFFYVLSRWLEKNISENLRDGLRRHLGFFNTHPFMAPYLVGVVARLEEDGHPLAGISAKDALMSPMGAIGDSFFWGSLRPLFIVIGLGIALTSPWLGIAFTLVGFNIFSIYVRWDLLGKGYENAENPLDFISDRHFRGAAHGGQIILIPALGFLLGLAVFGFASPVFGIAAFITALTAFSLGLGTFRAILLVTAVMLLMVFLGLELDTTWLV